LLAGGIVVAVASYVVLQGTQGSRQDSAAASGDSMPDARDAGPGGDRSRTMSVVPPESAATHVDTVYRDLSDRASSMPVPVVISHAESLAIAAAVSARQLRSDAVRRSAAPTATQTPGAALPAISASPGDAQVRIRSANGTATTVDREQLLAEVGRIFADSMARALLQLDSAMRRLPQTARIDVPRAPTTLTPMLAPPTDGRVRVVVTPYANATGQREYTATTRAVARDVRSAIPSDRYDVVTDTLTERAMRTMPDRMSVGWGLRADYVVTGMVSTRGDSVVVLTTFTDVRSGRFSRMSESMAPVADPTQAFPLAARQVNAWLDTAKVNRGRRPRGMQPD
jgi:serine/threonine-protein kinase